MSTFSKLIVLLLAVMFYGTCKADDLFSNCENLDNNKQYQPLMKYFSNNKEVIANYCQRLNNQQFLYTTADNFYYCDFSIKSDKQCEENEQGTWYPQELVKLNEFKNSNGKQFVLFSHGRLLHGTYSEGWHIFYFVSKKENLRGYTINILNDAGAYRGDSETDSEVCGDMKEKDNAIYAADKKNPYEIINNGKYNVGVRFLQKVVSCKTKKISTRIVEYTWSGKEFVRSKMTYLKL